MIARSAQHFAPFERFIVDRLMRRVVQGGETTDFEELYETYSTPLRRFARALTQDVDEAEDLVQDTFLRALCHLSAFSGMNSAQCKAWLFTALRNRKIDVDRRRYHERMYVGSVHLSYRADDTTAVLFQDLLERLPPSLREIVKATYWHGFTSRELGDRQGLSDNTIRARLRRAIQILRQEWEDGT